MNLRRGQHLINVVYFELGKQGYEPTQKNVENMIWNMSDKEFYEIINMSDKDAREYYNKEISK
jgi:hypothetical protein